MILSKIRNNCKSWQITSIKLVIAFLLFMAINDKMIFKNLYDSFQNLNNLSFDSILLDLVNISKVISFSPSIYIGIGLIFCQFMLVNSIIEILQLNISKFTFTEKTPVREVSYADMSDSKILSTNKIYLTTNKFIC